MATAEQVALLEEIIETQSWLSDCDAKWCAEWLIESGLLVENWEGMIKGAISYKKMVDERN